MLQDIITLIKAQYAEMLASGNLFGSASSAYGMISQQVRAVAGIGALIYIFSRLVGQIMRGEPIDFLPMLRPFFIVMLIALVPSLCNVIDRLGDRLVQGSEVGNQTLFKRIETQEALLKNAISKKWDKKAEENALKASTIPKQDEYVDEMGNKYSSSTDVGASFTEIVSDQFAEWADYIKAWLLSLIQDILLIMMQVAEAALLLISIGYRIILRLAAPVAFACAIFPGMTSAMSEWFAKYINYTLMPFVASIVGKIAFAFTFKYLYAYTQYFDSYGLKTGADNTDPTLMGVAFIGLLCCCLVLFFQVPSLTNMFVTAGGVGAMVSGATSLLDRGSQPVRGAAATMGRGALLGGTMLAFGTVEKLAGGVSGVRAWYGSRKESAKTLDGKGGADDPNGRGKTTTKGAAKSVDINPNQISGRSGGSAYTAKTPTKGLPNARPGLTVDPKGKPDAEKEKVLAGAGKALGAMGGPAILSGVGGDSTRSEGAPAKLGGSDQGGKGTSTEATTKTPGVGVGAGDSTGVKGAGGTGTLNPDGTPAEPAKGGDKGSTKDADALLVAGAAGAGAALAGARTDKDKDSPAGTTDAKVTADKGASSKGGGTLSGDVPGGSKAKSSAPAGGAGTGMSGNAGEGKSALGLGGGSGQSQSGADAATGGNRPTIERNEEVYEAAAMPSMSVPSGGGGTPAEGGYDDIDMVVPAGSGSETGQGSAGSSSNNRSAGADPERQAESQPSTAVGAFLQGFRQASFREGAYKGRDVLVKVSRFNDAFHNFSRFDTSAERMDRREREQQRREEYLRKLQAANAAGQSGSGSSDSSGGGGYSDSQGPVDSSPPSMPAGGGYTPDSSSYVTRYEDAAMPQQPVSVGSSEQPNEVIHRTIIVGPTNSSGGAAMAPQRPIDVSSETGVPSPRVRFSQPRQSAPSGSRPVSYAGQSVPPAGSMPITNAGMPLGYNGLGYAMPVSSMARGDQERLFSSLEPQPNVSGGGQPFQSREETIEYHQEVVRELQKKYHVNPEPPRVSLAPAEGYVSQSVNTVNSQPEPSAPARQPQNPQQASSFMSDFGGMMGMARKGIVNTSRNVGQSDLVQSMKQGARQGAGMGLGLMINTSRASRGLQHFAYLDTSDEIIERRRRQADQQERRRNKLSSSDALDGGRMFNEPGDNDYARRERRYGDGK